MIIQDPCLYLPTVEILKRKEFFALMDHVRLHNFAPSTIEWQLIQQVFDAITLRQLDSWFVLGFALGYPMRRVRAPKLRHRYYVPFMSGLYMREFASDYAGSPLCASNFWETVCVMDTTLAKAARAIQAQSPFPVKGPLTEQQRSDAMLYDSRLNDPWARRMLGHFLLVDTCRSFFRGSALLHQEKLPAYLDRTVRKQMKERDQAIASSSADHHNNNNSSNHGDDEHHHHPHQHSTDENSSYLSKTRPNTTNFFGSIGRGDGEDEKTSQSSSNSNNTAKKKNTTASGGKSNVGVPQDKTLLRLTLNTRFCTWNVITWHRRLYEESTMEFISLEMPMFAGSNAAQHYAERLAALDNSNPATATTTRTPSGTKSVHNNRNRGATGSSTAAQIKARLQMRETDAAMWIPYLVHSNRLLRERCDAALWAKLWWEGHFFAYSLMGIVSW